MPANYSRILTTNNVILTTNIYATLISTLNCSLVASGSAADN